VKVEHEVKLNCTEMSMIRWMCGIKLNDREKSEELRELLGLEPVTLIKKSRLRRFEHVECKDDNAGSNVVIHVKHSRSWAHIKPLPKPP